MPHIAVFPELYPHCLGLGAAAAAVGDQWRINFSRVQWNVTWDEQLKTYVKVRLWHCPCLASLASTGSTLCTR
jgi:hypothetical protein